jgi:hypothetical protein
MIWLRSAHDYRFIPSYGPATTCVKLSAGSPEGFAICETLMVLFVPLCVSG